jgi:hypothetical protein
LTTPIAPKSMCKVEMIKCFHLIAWSYKQKQWKHSWCYGAHECHTYGNWEVSQQDPLANHQGVVKIFEG